MEQFSGLESRGCSTTLPLRCCRGRGANESVQNLGALCGSPLFFSRCKQGQPKPFHQFVVFRDEPADWPRPT
jgi:hypothetical protein